MTDTVWRSPMPCPNCPDGNGRPRRAESKTAALVLVVLHCDECGHEWTAARETPWQVPPADHRPPAEESA